MRCVYLFNEHILSQSWKNWGKYYSIYVSCLVGQFNIISYYYLCAYEEIIAIFLKTSEITAISSYPRVMLLNKKQSTESLCRLFGSWTLLFFFLNYLSSDSFCRAQIVTATLKISADSSSWSSPTFTKSNAQHRLLMFRARVNETAVRFIHALSQWKLKCFGKTNSTLTNVCASWRGQGRRRRATTTAAQRGSSHIVLHSDCRLSERSFGYKPTTLKSSPSY